MFTATISLNGIYLQYCSCASFKFLQISKYIGTFQLHLVIGNMHMLSLIPNVSGTWS